MTAQSVPPLIVASIALFISLCALAVWLRQKRLVAALALCAVGVAFGLYDIAAAGLYNVVEPAESIPWLKAQTIALALICVTYSWVLSLFTGRPGKARMIAIAAWATLGIAAQILLPQALTWLPTRPLVHQGRFLFGISVTYIESDLGIATTAQDASSFAILALFLVITLRNTTRTGAIEMRLSVVTLVVVIAAAINDFAVGLGLSGSIYLLEYSWLLPLAFVSLWVVGQVSSTIDLRESLGESRELFRNFVEQSSESIVIVDADDRVVLVNPAAEAMFGIRRDEVVGRPRCGSMLQLALSAASCADDAGEAGGRTEAVVGMADGSKRYVWQTAFGIDTSGGAMTAILGRDVTTQRQDEAKLVESLRVNSLLLSELHHRVKNNIQMIISLLNLRSGQVQDPESLDILKACQNQLYAMALVHSMLNDPLDADRVDLKEYLSLLAESLVAEGGPRLAIDAEEVFVHAEMAIPCGLIVNELVTNSLKYAFADPASRRKSEISVTLKKRDADRAEMIVADNGSGLISGDRARSADFPVAGKGAGLGLKLVEMLVKQIKGELRTENRGGLRTVVEFPLAGTST